MRKKILILLLGLVGTFSVVYSFDYAMFASTSTYQAGGDVTGRVNMTLSNESGSVITSSSIGFQKGDKVLMGTKNPGSPTISLEWILLSQETYSDYGCITSSIANPVDQVCSNTSITNWLTISTKDIGKVAPNIAANAYQIGRNTNAASVAWKHIKLASYTDSPNITSLLASTTSEINKTNDGKLLAYRNLYSSRYKYNNPQSTSVEEKLYYKDLIDRATFPKTTNYDSLNKSMFLMPIDFSMVSGDGRLSTTIKAIDKSFYESYWSSVFYSDGASNSYLGFPVLTNGGSGFSPINSGITNTYKLSVRPLVYLDLKKVVFAVSNGTTSAIGKVKQTVLPNSYTAILDATGSYQGMKLRLEDTTLTSTTKFHQIENSKGSKIKVVAKDKPVNLKVEAKSGGNATTGFNTVSVLAFDTSGNFKYYRPLESAKGSGLYEFDTTGMNVGKYKIGIVNEVYKEGVNTPTNSSKITTLMDLEVVNALSLRVTKSNNLEYSKNVNQNDQVATISPTGGAGTITYTVVSDTSVSGHANDYEKFDIGADASGKPIVIVKDTNGLDAGDYYFKVNAIDANGDPTGGVDSSTVHITVAKTDPNLSFTDTTDPVNVAVNGSAFIEAFTHSNTDTSDASFALSYSSSITGVATVDTPSANTDLDVEVTPGSTAGNTTLTVSLAATKNYKAASITKTIHTYPNISLVFNPKSAAFSIDTVASIGSEVGTITLTGDSANYTYSMATATEAGMPAGSDTGNGYFDVQTETATSSKTMKVVTKLASVPQGTHNIVMKAVDQYGQVAYISGTITVSGKAQTDFAFYDYRDTTVNLTNKKLTIYYGETSASLIANGLQSSGAVTYALDDPTTTIIAVDPVDGKITVLDVGTVKVKATKAADSVYATSTIYMDVEVKPCVQTIAFNDTADPKDVTFDSTNPVILQDAIGKIKTGMPNEGDAGVGGITYSTSDPSIATVDTIGNVTLLDPGSTMKSFTLTATINASGSSNNPHYTTEAITKTIKVYPKGSATWNQSNQPQADNNAAGDRVGKVNVSGGAGTPSFHIPTTTTVDNIDYSFFNIDSAGNVSILKAITHDDLVGKTINTVQNAYEMNIEVEVTNGGSTTTLPITVYVKGATRTGLEFDDKDPLTMEITKTYKEEPNNTFALGLNQVITGTTIAYSLSTDAGNPSDVISVASDGTATILNANEGGSYQPAKVEALVPMCNGYEETIVKGNVRIKKADQVLVFSQDPINTDISVSSLNISVTGHKDSYDLVYSSSDSDIEVDPDASDSNQMIIKPNGKAVNGVTITALASGDRNYNSTSKPVTLNISATVTQPFVASFPKMTYGDTDPKAVTITPNDPSSTYTYTVTDTSILDIDSSGNITIHHAGDTTVQVSKTDASGTLGPYSFNVSVKQRPITVTIDNKVKYVGMELPDFTSQITSGSLVGSDTLGTLTYSCLKKDNTPVNKDSEADIYTITGRYTSPNTDYKITIVDGILEVKQDAGEATWYHLEDIDGTTTTSSKWHKDSVDVVLNPSSASTAGIYDQIGNSLAFTNASTSPDRFRVSEEGETLQDIYFRIDPAGSSPNKGAVTSPIQETILIDKTAPTIKTITATDTNNTLQDIINKLSGGIFFQPSTAFEITTSDEKDELKVSETSTIDYKIYKQNEDKTYGSPMKEDTLAVTNEKAKVTISDTTGTYKICVLPKDNAGNVPKAETCKELTLKKLNVDIDGDGEDDFNDIDGNGCADFNIIYTDEKDGKQKVLNVDANRDGILEMNIDSDGDGRPDINVDTDGDGKPDVNLLIITKEQWKPGKCVTQHGEEYESEVDLTPVINVDLDFKDVTDISKAIPNINIDTNGDMKADLNITKDSETKPYLNIATIESWKPNQDYTYKGFSYDTIHHKPYLNIDSDNDGFPDINVDLDGDGITDINIDVDGDGIPDVDIDSTGDGEPNINIDTNHDGNPDQNIVEIKEWKPEKNGEYDGTGFDTMEIKGNSELEDNGIIVEKPDGTFLPNFAIKVDDVTESKKEEVEKEASHEIEETQEVKSVYDVKLLENDVEVQPNGTLKVRIPIPEGISNPKLLVKKSNGTYEAITVKEENGYLVYETNELGTVAVIGDKDSTPDPEPDPKPKPEEPDPEPDPTPKPEEPDPEPDPTPKPEEPDPEPNDPKPNDPKTEQPTNQNKPTTSVQGTYYPGNNVGGASTGDTSNMYIYFLGILLLPFILMIYKNADRR